MRLKLIMPASSRCVGAASSSSSSFAGFFLALALGFGLALALGFLGAGGGLREGGGGRLSACDVVEGSSCWRLRRDRLRALPSSSEKSPNAARVHTHEEGTPIINQPRV